MIDVYISPSPAHFNVGYGNYGTEELRMNLIADVVEYELARHGLSTVRNSPDMGLVEVAADANAQAAQIYVAIQSQAANTLQRGVQVYYDIPESNGERLATDIFENLKQITPTEDIGISNGGEVYGGLGFYELRKTKMPSVIVMVGFHDNPPDADFIIDNTYEIGVQIAKGILQYFGIPYNEDIGENIQNMKATYNGVTF